MFKDGRGGGGEGQGACMWMGDTEFSGLREGWVKCGWNLFLHFVLSLGFFT